MSNPGAIDLPFVAAVSSGPLIVANPNTSTGYSSIASALPGDSFGTLFPQTTMAVLSTPQVIYGVGYCFNSSAGDPTDRAQYISSPRIGNMNGGKPNTSSGVATIVSTSDLDVGNLSIVGNVSSAWVQASTLLTGTTPVSSTQHWDTGSYAYAEYLDPITNLPTLPVGDISITISGQMVGFIYGNSHFGGRFTHTTALFKTVLVDKNTVINLVPSNVFTDHFTSDGVTTAFTLTHGVDPTTLIVTAYNSLISIDDLPYSFDISTNILTLTIAIPDTDVLAVQYLVATPPSGLGTFEYNYVFPEDDQSLTISGGNFSGDLSTFNVACGQNVGDTVGLCVLMNIPAGMPLPIGGELEAGIAILGNPQTP